MTRGGQDFSAGEQNPRSKLTDKEVFEIRNRIYNQKEERDTVYEDYKDVISYSRFWSAFSGETYKNVDTSMIEPLKTNVTGSRNPRAKVNEEQILEIRSRVHIKKEDPIQVYQDYKDIIAYSTFGKILRGETWKNVDCSMIEPIKTERKNRPKSRLTKEEVALIRYQFENNLKTLSELYSEYSFVSNITIRRVVNYET